MLEKIIEMAEGYVKKTVDNTNEVPNDKKDAVSSTILNTLESNLKSQSGSGFDLNTLTHLFSGSQSSNLENSLITSLTNKVGLDPKISSMIVAAVLPGLMKMITNKFAGENSGSNNLVGNLLGKLGI